MSPVDAVLTTASGPDESQTPSPRPAPAGGPDDFGQTFASVSGPDSGPSAGGDGAPGPRALAQTASTPASGAIAGERCGLGHDASRPSATGSDGNPAEDRHRPHAPRQDRAGQASSPVAAGSADGSGQTTSPGPAGAALPADRGTPETAGAAGASAAAGVTPQAGMHAGGSGAGPSPTTVDDHPIDGGTDPAGAGSATAPGTSAAGVGVSVSHQTSSGAPDQDASATAPGSPGAPPASSGTLSGLPGSPTAPGGAAPSVAGAPPGLVGSASPAPGQDSSGNAPVLSPAANGPAPAARADAGGQANANAVTTPHSALATGGTVDQSTGNGPSTPNPVSPAAGASPGAGATPAGGAMTPPASANVPSGPAPGAAPGTATAQPSPTPAQQVVTVLAPLRSEEDGVHQVTIGLQPAGMGTVKATITVDNGQVAVQLGADSDDAHDALRQSLPLLQHELSKDGQPATVVLSDTDQERPSRSQTEVAERKPGIDDDADIDGAALPTASSGPRAGRIDLRL